MKCICCNSSYITKKFEKRSYNIFECNACGFQFVYPLPSEETIEKYYNKTCVSDDIRDRIKNSIYNLNSNSNNPKRDWYDKILARASSYTQKESMSILEVGSAYGYFIDYCNKKGHKAIGVEVTEEYATASKGLINGEVLYLKPSEYKAYFDGKKFDFIYLEHVFEHVLGPKELLNNLEYLLNDQGVIIIIVPNHKSFMSRLFRKHYIWLNPPAHLYFYNENSLRVLAENAGLFLDEAWADDYYHRSIYQFYSLDFFTRRIYQVINKLFKQNFNFGHSYKYPRKLADIVTLIPYFVLYPIIKFLNRKYRMGNELTMIFGKELYIKKNKLP